MQIIVDQLVCTEFFCSLNQTTTTTTATTTTTTTTYLFFYPVIEICARNRLKHFRRSCDKIPKSQRPTIPTEELMSFPGIIHDTHKLLVEAFPNSGSEDFKIGLYNNTSEERIQTDGLTSEQL